MAEETTEQTVAKRIGEYLVCSPGTLQSAVKRQGQALKLGQPVQRIGEILVENGEVSAEELESAIIRQRRDRIRRCPVFSLLTATELAAVSGRFKEVSVPAGKQFIIQDDPDPTLYIIASGKVQVYRMDLEGNETHFAYVEDPEPIGEMGYFSGGKRTASVRAVDTVQLLQAEYSALTHYFEHVPHVAHAFMQLVDERRKATEQITQNK